MSEENKDQEPDHIKDLRAKAERSTQAEAELAAAKRELAFTKAGVNTDSKPAQALLNSYAGDLTTEAIKAEAAEWGLTGQGSSAPPTDGEPPVLNYDPTSPEAQHQALQDQEAHGNPAPTPPPPTKTTYEDAFEQYAASRKDGMPRRDAEVEAVARVISGGAQGDAGARFDPAEWMQKAMAAGHGGNVAR